MLVYARWLKGMAGVRENSSMVGWATAVRQLWTGCTTYAGVGLRRLGQTARWGSQVHNPTKSTIYKSSTPD
jgi:hypothetical protein